MRLIDADKLKKKKRFFRIEEYGEEAVAVHDIDNATTVDPVKHGKWIEKPFLLGTSNFCSLCGENYGMPHGKFNYCANCGAKMDLE